MAMGKLLASKAALTFKARQSPGVFIEIKHLYLHRAIEFKARSAARMLRVSVLYQDVIPTSSFQTFSYHHLPYGRKIVFLSFSEETITLKLASLRRECFR